MSSSISWWFPGASSMVFSWAMFLKGPAPAGRITLVLWDRLGQEGMCQLLKQQVAGFLKEEHCTGATSSQLLVGALSGQWLECCLPSCGRAPAVGKHLSSGAACHQACRTVAREGTLPLCRFSSCPSVSLLYCLGSRVVFYEDRLHVNSLFFGTNRNVLNLVNYFMVLMQH